MKGVFRVLHIECILTLAVFALLLVAIGKVAPAAIDQAFAAPEAPPVVAEVWGRP